MITATNSSGEKREIVPAGNYIARCYSMVQIGTVVEEVMGKIKSHNKVNISWELPTELAIFNEAKGEQPHVVSKEYNLYMNEKANLRKDLESWRGKPFTEEQAKSFDITKLLGIPCMLNIIHKTTQKGSTYAYISNISQLPKSLVCPPQINTTFEFNFEDKWDEKVLENFPDFLKNKIKSSDEYKALKAPIGVQHDEPEQDNESEPDKLPF